MARLPAISLPLSAAIIAVLSLALFGLRDAEAIPPGLHVVTKEADTNDGTCDPDCSLREAITASNNDGVDSTINLDGTKTYQLTIPGQFDDFNDQGDLDILADVTINGHGATIEQTVSDRVIEIYPSLPVGTVTLNDLTITGGNSANLGGGGGGIKANNGSLVLDHVTVTDNNSIENGGGIFIAGDASLNMTSSHLTNNTSSASGGGMSKLDGTGSIHVSDTTFSINKAQAGGGLSLGISSSTQITDSTITGNIASSNLCSSCQLGGGIYQGAGFLTISGGSISNNHADDRGGGAYLPSANLSGVTISGNSADGEAGGLDLYAGTLQDSTVTNNQANATGGVSLGSATILRTVVAGNQSAGSGGGVTISQDGSIDHSEISGNTAVTDGAGVRFFGTTPAISNSTITNNTAGRGGGIFRAPLFVPDAAGNVAEPQGGPNPGTATLDFVTISNNTAPDGANIWTDGTNGEIDVHGSIIGKPSGGPDCSMALTSTDYNVEQGASCGFNQPNDVGGVDPLLGPLLNNGGDTKTRALMQNSPAINRAPSGQCPASNDDQRGTARPIGGACDSGAFESNFTSTPTSTPTSEPTPSPTGPPTDTSTPSPTPTSSPGTQRLWGDADCNGSVAPREPG